MKTQINLHKQSPLISRKDRSSSWCTGLILIGIALLLGTTSAEAGNCLQGCDIGQSDTFLGQGALESDTTGADNTAIGLTALQFNTTASNNTASGFSALFVNTSGADNTASGASALQSN